ncbi:MAG: cupin domain-containing protein [Caldimonas sp.]
MSKAMTFSEFAASARREGFDEVLEREWKPGVEVASHTHPFAVKAIVARGEMWLTVGESTRHLRVGDTFELAHSAPHAERYGPKGATYWVARRKV